MNRCAIVVSVVSVMFAACGTSRCVTGQSVSCACVDGKMGAQTCMADGTYGGCQCGVASCNSSNCPGCCDATGVCLSGAISSACGRSANLCVACGSGQSCEQGACVTSGQGGGSGGTGGGSGSGGGGSAIDCGFGNCSQNGNCLQSVENRVGGACGANNSVCASCTSSQHCVSGSCVAFKRVFATRTAYTGNLGGLAGADAKCALAASAAGLPGTYKAWVSDGSTDALSRITADGPWFTVRGDSLSDPSTLRMFNNKANLQTLPLDNYLAWADETGASVEGGIWTGTSTGGARSATNCGNWASTAAMGMSGRVGGTTGESAWTEYTTLNCTNMLSLLCFEN